MARKAVKQVAPEFEIPQTMQQVVDAIAEIGVHQRERQRIEAAMNDEMAKVKQIHEEAAEPHNQAIRLLSQGVQVWCSANRKELTKDDKVKTVTFPSGKVLWRTCPSKVTLQNVEKVIETLRGLGLSRFLRKKEEVDKDAILKEPGAVKDVPGIKIKKSENFVIEPFETELEEVI